MIYISNQYCYFELSIHQSILKNKTVSIKNIDTQKQFFSIHNSKSYY